MGRRQELERKLDELIASASWDEVVPRLQAYTVSHLSRYGESEGRRWHHVTQSYVLRAVEAVVHRGSDYVVWHEWNTLHQLLCKVVGQLIDEDERRLDELLERANWADIIPRVLAHTVRRLGTTIGAQGKSPEDYVYEAVLQLFTRRRHFPFERDVSLLTFLCKTVHGMRTNHAASGAAERRHVSLVDSDEPEAGQYNAARIAAPADPAFVERELSRTVDDFIASLEPDLQPYARLRAQEAYGTAAEYATALGVTVEVIRNYDRRLRRRRRRWDEISRGRS